MLCTMKPMLQKKQFNYIVTDIRNATKLEFLPYAFVDVSEVALQHQHLRSTNFKFTYSFLLFLSSFYMQIFSQTSSLP